MTVSAKRNEIAYDRLVKRQAAAKDVMRSLSKILAGTLVIAFVLCAFLTVTKALPIFYTVSEKKRSRLYLATLSGI